MFTWICPTCGREVPPSYDACPDCAARAKAGAPPEQSTAPPPPSPAGAPPEPVPQYVPPAPRAALPTWLLTVVFAFAFVGLGGGVYWLVQHFRSGTQSAASVPGETLPVKGAARQNPLQKYVEIAGIRFVTGSRNETEARFVIVNHSGADIAGLTGSVNIWGRTVKSEEEAAGNFSFNLASLGAYESKEMTAPVKTKLKVYELPDWQNVSTDLQITAP